MKSFITHLSEAHTFKISRAMYDELYAMEVDTLTNHSAADKKSFVDSLTNSKKVSGGYNITVETDAWRYLKDNALPNIIDITADAGNHALNRSARTLRSKL